MKMLSKFGIFVASLIFCGLTYASTSCTVASSNVWNNGYVLEINVTNNGTTPINNWAVTLNYIESARVIGGWNATFAGGATTVVTASNVL